MELSRQEFSSLEFGYRRIEEDRFFLQISIFNAKTPLHYAPSLKLEPYYPYPKMHYTIQGAYKSYYQVLIQGGFGFQIEFNTKLLLIINSNLGTTLGAMQNFSTYYDLTVPSANGQPGDTIAALASR